MNKKGVRLARYLRYFMFIFIIYIAVIAINEPTITGMVVYEEQTLEKDWDFSNPADYTYDGSLIDLSNQQAELISETITNNWTTEKITEIYSTSAIFRKLGEDPIDMIALFREWAIAPLVATP